MGNKLKILLIIAPVLLFSCSFEDNYDSNTRISKYNNKNTDVFSDQKYQEIYTNLYLRLALQKSLDTEALNLFLSDMSIVKSDQLIEKLSSIAKASYRYEDLISISKYWIKANKNSYKAISYGFSASVELNKKNVAENFYNNFVILTSPKSNRDFARILFELQSNKNRKNVISFVDDLIEDNNSRQLRIAYIDLLYTFNLPHQVIENVNSIKIFNDSFSKNHKILLGINSNQNSKIYNSMAVLDNNLRVLSKYNKNKLVPFGEFLPLEKFLKKIGLKKITQGYISFSAADERKILLIENIRFLPLICYEIIYSGKINKNDEEYVFIMNISEDGWFGNSIGPHQHFSHSIFRSIEEGKNLIRSTNGGISAYVDAVGNVVDEIKSTDKGVIEVKSYKKTSKTFFSRYGNKIFFYFLIFYITLIFFIKKKGR